VESIVRAQGATPATIAILDGYATRILVDTTVGAMHASRAPDADLIEVRSRTACRDELTCAAALSLLGSTLTGLGPTSLPPTNTLAVLMRSGRLLAAGFAHDERYAEKSVGEKVRTVADPCLAVFGFHPVGSRWGVNAACPSKPNGGLAGFCDQVAELQRAMGTNCAPSERGDLRCVGADVRACLPAAPAARPPVEFGLPRDSGPSRMRAARSRGC
jgi:hypothetical protein